MFSIGSTEKEVKYEHLIASVALIAVILLSNVAYTAWSADMANTGPTIAVVQLSSDEDVEWATNDIVTRLRTFISDDAFLSNRIVVYQSGDPSIVLTIQADVVIWVSHGGMKNILTGSKLTTWETMAALIEQSSPQVHLFAACFSMGVLDFGSDDSTKWVYGVPGRRPAEIIDIDIVAAVMHYVGTPSEDVEEYRTAELTAVKEQCSAEQAHFLSFNQIMLDRISTINAEYRDLMDDLVDFEYRSSLTTITSVSGLTYDLQVALMRHFGVDHTGPDPVPRQVQSVYVEFNKSEYRERVGGVWGEWTYYLGRYNGWIAYSGTELVYADQMIDVENNKERFQIRQKGLGDLVIQYEKQGGTWAEPRVSRNNYNTGGIWGDFSREQVFKYDPNWPVVPSAYSATGQLTVEGTSDQTYTIESIPSGSSWHGPSFVKVLPATVAIKDLGCFSADLGLLHHGSSSPISSTYVALYDENKELAFLLGIRDAWKDYAEQTFHAKYFGAGQQTPAAELYTDHIQGDVNGTVKIYYDPYSGIRADMPTKSDSVILGEYSFQEHNRVLKYVAIQSYRYSSYPEHHEIVDNITVQYTRMQYSLFEDDCIANVGWIAEPSWDNAMGTVQTGISLHSDGDRFYSGAIPGNSASSHGAVFAKRLEKALRISDGIDLAVDLEHVYNYGYMGHVYVVLYDHNYERLLSTYVVDAWYGSRSDARVAYYKSQDEGGGYLYQTVQKSYSWSGVLRVWYDTGSGALKYSILGSGGTLASAGSFDSTRTAHWITLQFMNKQTYSYQSKYVRDIELTAGIPPTESTWHDPCSSTSGWVYDLSWPTPIWGTASGSLTSNGEYLQTASNSGWATGPFWYKELPDPFYVSQLSEFSVTVEFSNPSGSYKGGLGVALYDAEKKMVASARVIDWTDAQISASTYLYWHPEGGGSYSAGKSGITSTSWYGTLTLSYVEGTGLEATMPGVSDSVILSPEERDTESSRRVRYIGIQWRRGSGTYLNMKLHDILLKHYIRPRTSGGGYSGSAGVEPDDPSVTENEWTIPPPYDDPDPEEPGNWWELENGYWPRYHVKAEKTDASNRKLMMHMSVDFLCDSRMEASEVNTGGETISEAEAIAREQEFNAKYTTEIDPLVVIGVVILEGLHFVAFIASALGVVSAPEFFALYGAYTVALMVYASLILHHIMQVFEDPFDRFAAWFNALMFAIIFRVWSVISIIPIAILLKTGMVHFSHDLPENTVIMAFWDLIFLIWAFGVLLLLWEGGNPY